MNSSVLNSIITNSEYDGVFLFVGSKGNIISSINVFIKHVLCTDHTACGHCSACKKVDAGVHADVIVANKSKNRYLVDDFKSLISDVYQKSFEGGKKVFVIYDADSLDEVIQNKLLKILEEPPDNTVIILGVNNINSLLPTVISRCRVIRIDYSDISITSNQLVKEFGINRNDANIIASASQGDYELASDLVSNGYITLRNDVFNVFIRILTAKSKAYNAYLKKLLEHSDCIDNLFIALNSIFHDIMQIKWGFGEEIENTDLIEYLKSSIKNITISKIITVYSIIEETSNMYFSCNNINKKLLIEKLLIEILNKTV